jgi:methyl-accepting chemotaxis protein
MFKQLGIKTKLVLSFTAIAMISVIVGGVSFYYSRQVIGIYQSIAKENVPNLKQFINMKAALTSMTVPIASLANTSSTPADAAKAEAELDESNAEFEQASKTYESSPFAPGEEEVWNDFKKTHWQAFLDISHKMIQLSGTSNKDDQKLRDKMWEKEYAESTKLRREAFVRLVQFQLDNTSQKEQSGDALDTKMRVMILAIVLAGFAVASVAGYAIATYLARELTQVAETLNAGSLEVNSAVTQLSNSSEELSTSSSQQAASVQETASAIEEINAMVQKNAQNASESAQISSQSKLKALDGKQAVDRMARSMTDIHQSNQKIQTQIEESNTKIGDIVHVIQEIGNKTKVVNDIVFQTKLLSFNASVEAARAGEHGKGFAVVAEEVGNLAQMSGASAEEITKLLEESVKKVETVVQESKQAVESLMLQARETVENGNKTAHECGQVLEEIVSNVERLSEMVAGISSASQEQSRGVEEVSKAVQEIDQATQSNATAAQQTAASSHQLSAQVGSLQAAAERLRILVYGGTT